jgi:hypothetical protein
MGVGGQRHALTALPRRITRYPLYRRLGRPQGRSGQVLKISSPPGLDPRTLQLVASRYTDYAIPAHGMTSIGLKWKGIQVNVLHHIFKEENLNNYRYLTTHELTVAYYFRCG